MEATGKYRSLKGWLRWIPVALTSAGLIHTVIQIFSIAIGGKIMLMQAFLGALLAYFLSIAFLLVPARKKRTKDKIPWYDWLGFLVCMVGGLFMAIFGYTANLEGWASRPPLAAVIIGVVLILAILELIRRYVGLVMLIVIAVFLVYPLLGRYVPGLFRTNPYTINRLVGFSYLGPDGIFGIPMDAFGRLLIGYIIFGVVLQWIGGVEFLYKLALILVGTIRGGGAKVCILSSAFFSMISGSTVANVVTIGSMTIPSMKRLGYSPEYAGATEACASTGGPLTPPVMGIAAFLMVDFLRVSYATICIAAAIPALLYYMSLFIQNDCYAARSKMVGFPRSELPSIRSLTWGWFIPIGIAALVFFLLYFNMESRAPYYASAALLALAFVQKKTRPNLKGLVAFLDDTGRTLVDLVVILAGIGIIIGSLQLTGITFGIPTILLKASGGNAFLLVLFTAIAAFVLGTGLTITIVYLFLVVMLAPTLINLGLNPLSVHLFILYWAASSFLTPPVAIASYAAAAIAQANPFRVSWIACRMGIMIYLSSFLFILNPLLIGQGSPLKILMALGMAAVGTIAVSAGIEGYLYWHGKISAPMRVLTMAIGLGILATVALFIR